MNTLKFELGRGVEPGPFPEFSDLLWEWVHVLERTNRVWLDDDDAAWLYGERSSVSVLAGAAWRVGGLAFEEYATAKARNRLAAKGKRGLGGRGDLFFQLGEVDYMVEAKQVEVALQPGRRPNVTRVETSLRAACSDVRRSRRYFEYIKLGVLFARPTLPQGCQLVEAAISEWLDEVRRLRQVAIAWVFPEQARQKHKGGRLSPGVALLVRSVGKVPHNV